MSSSRVETPGILSWGALVVYGVGSLIARLIAILSWIGYQALNLLNWAPIFLVAVVFAFVAFGWQQYHDEIMESTEFGLRCVIRPVWVDTVTPVYTLLQRIYNPLICWWNAANWLFFGIWREVVFPLATQCGIQDAVLNAGQVIFVFADTFVADYIATGNFLQLATGIYDFAALSAAWTTFWQSWQNIFCCACGDLCKFFRLQPLIVILPGMIMLNPLALLGSDQIGDPQFFCFLGNLFNALINVVQQLFNILVYLISLFTNPMPGPFPRPDFDLFANLLCASVTCLIRSIENAAQLFVDCYLPFPFNFIEFFCIVDVAFCIAIKSVALILKIFINIDRIVFHPVNPFYATEVKTDMKEILNLYAPLRYPPWQLSTTDPASPVFGKRRLTECLCIFIERLLCDPSAVGTACFDPGAQLIIGDFDFCCFFAEAITFIVDVVAGLGEWSCNLYSAEAFFRFVDTGAYLALDSLKLDLVALVDCLGKVLNIIPVVGFCLRTILTTTASILFCFVVFILKFAISVLSVGFFAGLLMDTNWLTTPGRALGEFEAILLMLAPRPENTPEGNAKTLANGICCTLNRIPIPPLPCTNCNPGGWIEEDGTVVKKADWGNAKMRSILDPDWDEHARTLHLTPPIKYPNQTRGGLLGFDPISAKNRIFENLERRRRSKGGDIPLVERDVNAYVETKRIEMLEKFRKSNAEGGRAQSLADWSYRFQSAIQERSSDSELHQFMPRGVTHIKRYDNGFKNVSLDEDNVMRGYNTRTGYREEVDERIICMPTPTCFDFCCIFRNTLIALQASLLLVARFLDGIIHGSADNYNYFRGDGFETDLRAAITAIINILQCVCDFIELVFPIPNLDLCCPIIKLGELLNGILGVIINGIKSLALDFPTFSYFTNGMFEADVDELFNLTLEVVVCLCDILRAILPIPGVDPCCLPQIALFVVIELLRLVLQTIINLSTIATTGLDYFQNPNLEEIGIIKQLDVVINLLFGEPGGQCSRFFNNGFHGGTGNGGIVSCFCQIVNLVIPARPCPGLPVGSNLCPSPENCPYLDLCCIFREIGFVLASLLKFIFRLMASFWQPWVNGIPQTFIDFLFCDENATPFIFTPFPMPNPLYKPSCGKLEPTIMAIRNLVADCPCAFFQYIDFILPGPGCFCGLNVGIFQAVPDFVVEVVRILLKLLRNFWSPFYWNPPPTVCGFSPFNPPRQCSWALTFFGPISDRLCTALISLTCFLDNLLMIPCRATRQNLVGSLIVWAFDILIRAVEIIEGIADAFAGTCFPPAGSVGGLPGTSTSCLAGALAGIFALPIDILIADALLPMGENSQLDGLLAGLPTCNGVPVSGILLNAARYLSCTFFAIPVVGIAFGFAMHGLVIFLSILWQILRKIIRVIAAFFNLLFSLFQLFSGVTCACWGPERHQQGFGFAVGFCYRCLVDPCTTCGPPNGHGDCRGEPCCISTEPAEPKVLCTFLGVIIAFFDLVAAFFGIFTPPPVIPDTVTAKDEPTPSPFSKEPQTPVPDSWLDNLTRTGKDGKFIPLSRFSDPKFRERAKEYAQRDNGGKNTDVFELIFSGIVGYDVTDCPSDPVSCICRNYPTHMEGICSWDYVNQTWVSQKPTKADVTPDDVLHGMAKNCNGTSACDWYIQGCADHGWEHMSDTAKLDWTECINKHTAGSRIHDVAPVFPADFFTRQDGILQLLHNVRKEAIDYGRREQAKWEGKKVTELDKQKIDNPQGKTNNEILIEHFRHAKMFVEKEESYTYRNPMIRDMALRLDHVEFKVRSGMLSKKVKKAHWNVGTGQWRHEMYPALVDFKDSWVDLGGFMWRTEWRQMIFDGGSKAAEVFYRVSDDVRRIGEHLSVKGIWAWNPITHYWDRRAEWIKEQDPHREDFKSQRVSMTEAFYRGPVYKWWNSPWQSMRNPMRPFLNHMGRILRINRNPDKYPDSSAVIVVNGTSVPNSLLTIDKRLTIIKDAIIKRWTPRWTPAIQGEWDKVLGIFFRMYHFIWPGTLTREVEERFVFNCNCTIADRTLELVVDVVDYCLNDFMFNLPPDKRDGSALQKYLSQTSPKRKGFMRDRTHEWAHRTNSSIVWQRSNPKDPYSWIRPKIIHAAPYKRRNFAAIPKPYWKRAVTFVASSTNVYTQFICWLEDALGLDFSANLAQFFLDLRDWFLNDNLDPAGCPDDVGFLYWVTFFFRCEFPEYLNSSNPCAVGLKEALRVTIIWSLIIFGGLSLFLPALLLPLTAFSAFIFYLIVIPAAAWHYSPQCWLIFPSIPIPGVGITVPFLPFPIGLPVLPEKLLDDVKELLDELLGPCPFENFRGIIPLCLYNGNPCPACPERIDLANCVNVGIADGVSNLVYLLQWIWPEGLDFITITLGQTCFFGGCLIPFLNFDYLQSIKEDIINAGPTQACRQEWCFWATIISIIFPVVAIAVIGGLSIILLALLFGLIWDLFYLGAIFLLPITSGDASEYGFDDNRYYSELNDRSMYESPLNVGGEFVDANQFGDAEEDRRRRRRRRRRRQRPAEVDEDIERRRRLREERLAARDNARSGSFVASFAEIVSPFWQSGMRALKAKEKLE